MVYISISGCTLFPGHRDDEATRICWVFFNCLQQLVYWYWWTHAEDRVGDDKCVDWHAVYSDKVTAVVPAVGVWMSYKQHRLTLKKKMYLNIHLLTVAETAVGVPNTNVSFSQSIRYRHPHRFVRVCLLEKLALATTDTVSMSATVD